MTTFDNTRDTAESQESPFSKECPSLLIQHFQQLHDGSGISVEVIKERRYESVLGKKRLADLGFSKAQQRAPGILMPQYSVDGNPIAPQYRPDFPRLNAKEKPIKYENLIGSSVRLDVPRRCLKQLSDPGVPIFFTEGVKKVDSLASRGACAVGLIGVWGFKGKNVLGGTSILADFDYITLRGRLVYLAFDSDASSNPQVGMALKRLAEHLSRKGAKVKPIYLPPGPGGQKTGVDDYLAQGHTLDDLIALPNKEPPSPPPTKAHQVYTVEDGRICWLKPTPSGEVLTPLCNFDTKVVEDIVKDNGIERQRFFAIEGKLASGKELSKVQVQANHFNAMGWVSEHWGVRAVIGAGITLKDRLREAIQLQSQNALERRVFTHTGWRQIEGTQCFLTSSGALGFPEVEVELDLPLQGYKLPLEETTDTKEAIRASLSFLDIGEAKVVIPLWAAMYLAPLSEVLVPAFTLWLVGTTGTFKSTVQALALCHFGEFTLRSLPASWRGTANYLEKLMALAKDIPLVIDDWAPSPDTKQSRELEIKAERVARGQGNRLGRGRLRSDISTRPAYIPRGVVVTNGEQLPSGQSHTARLFSSEIEPGDIDIKKLTTAQEAAHLYPFAMSAYIQWLAAQWEDMQKELPKAWDEWRHQAQAQGQHPRVPESVAWLYAGFDLALAFAEEVEAVSRSEARERRDQAWDTLIELADMQGGRVEEERPGHRFLEGLKALMDEAKVTFRHKDEEPARGSPFETQIGWRGDEGILYLNPYPAYSVVYDFWRKSGDPMTFKANAVWKDLKRMNQTLCSDGRTSTTAWISGKSRRVIGLKMKALET